MSEMTILDPSEVSTEANPGHNDTLTILKGPYEGLRFRYDAVWYDDQNPKLGLQFHYKLLNGVIDSDEDRADFEHAIAHLLHKQMKKTLAESGVIVYKGGTDSSRDELMDHLDVGNPEKNLAQQIMQAPGVFLGKKEESASNFLDRLAAQGMAAMKKQ